MADVSAPVVAVVAGCQGCGACLRTCPEHAIRPAPVDGAPAVLVVLPERCTGCGECVEICPVDAVHLVEAAHVVSSRYPREQG